METGGRWSKPHVSTPSLHSLFDLRSAIQRGTCVLELDLDVGHDLPSSTSGAAAERRTASLDHVAGRQSIQLFNVSYFGRLVDVGTGSAALV